MTKARKVTVVLAAVLALLVVAELPFPHHAPVFPWHHVTGLQGMIGFFSCVVVVILSKWLGKLFLQRPEKWDPEEREDA